mmetsp:Transcript_2290/g.7695  ORF Transcript_2290/g.7695 Transcript_2290/m.7695 type:complete len:258 (-) Transcript_2290:977-1750(-)
MASSRLEHAAFISPSSIPASSAPSHQTSGSSAARSRELGCFCESIPSIGSTKDSSDAKKVLLILGFSSRAIPSLRYGWFLEPVTAAPSAQKLDRQSSEILPNTLRVRDEISSSLRFSDRSDTHLGAASSPPSPLVLSSKKGMSVPSTKYGESSAGTSLAQRESTIKKYSSVVSESLTMSLHATTSRTSSTRAPTCSNDFFGDSWMGLYPETGYLKGIPPKFRAHLSPCDRDKAGKYAMPGVCRLTPRKATPSGLPLR